MKPAPTSNAQRNLGRVAELWDKHQRNTIPPGADNTNPPLFLQDVPVTRTRQTERHHQYHDSSFQDNLNELEPINIEEPFEHAGNPADHHIQQLSKKFDDISTELCAELSTLRTELATVRAELATVRAEHATTRHNFYTAFDCLSKIGDCLHQYMTAVVTEFELVEARATKDMSDLIEKVMQVIPGAVPCPLTPSETSRITNETSTSPHPASFDRAQLEEIAANLACVRTTVDTAKRSFPEPLHDAKRPANNRVHTDRTSDVSTLDNMAFDSHHDGVGRP